MDASVVVAKYTCDFGIQMMVRLSIDVKMSSVSGEWGTCRKLPFAIYV